MKYQALLCNEKLNLLLLLLMFLLFLLFAPILSSAHHPIPISTSDIFHTRTPDPSLTLPIAPGPITGEQGPFPSRVPSFIMNLSVEASILA